MKFGFRTPSLKKRISARTTGALKRKVKKAVIPGYGMKGMGMIKNPRKSIYNRVYSRTTVDPLKVISSHTKNGNILKRASKGPWGTENESKTAGCLLWIFLFFMTIAFFGGGGIFAMFGMLVLAIYGVVKWFVNLFNRNKEPEDSDFHGSYYRGNYREEDYDDDFQDEGSSTYSTVEGKMEFNIDCEIEAKHQRNIRKFIKEWMKEQGLKNYGGLLAKDIKFDELIDEHIYESPQDKVFFNVISLENIVRKDGKTYISVSIKDDAGKNYGEIGEIPEYNYREIKNLIDRGIITLTEIKVTGGKYKMWNGERIVFDKNDYSVGIVIRFKGKQSDFTKEAGYDWDKIESEINEVESL